MLLFCASVTRAVSLYGFSSTHMQCINVLFDLYIFEFYKFLIYVFLCAFILLLVFLHGCVQCFYTSSMWQSHLPLGCSICVCHHGPHHLQPQVLAPTMSSHLMSGLKQNTLSFFRFKCGVPQWSVWVLCFVLVFCMLLLANTFETITFISISMLTAPHSSLIEFICVVQLCFNLIKKPCLLKKKNRHKHVLKFLICQNSSPKQFGFMISTLCTCPYKCLVAYKWGVGKGRGVCGCGAV